MSNLVTAEYNETTQAQVYDKNFRQGSTPQIRRFNNWPSLGFLLASLVAGATAARTSGVVTVTATAHGITTGATYVGYKYFYPGSSSLAAGWYDSILTIPDANTLTFSAAGADFGSESVNGGAAYTSATDTISMIIPGNTLRDQSKLRIHHARSGGTTAAAKSVQGWFGGSSVCGLNAAAAPNTEALISFRCYGTTKQIGFLTPSEGTLGSAAFTTITKDITVDQTLMLRLSVGSPADFVILLAANVEIIG